LTSLPELPVCIRLSCGSCTNLTSLPYLPVCTRLNCESCTSLTSLPDLPVCTWLDCKYCIDLTYINVHVDCKVLCEHSPISNYNNELYLSYLKDRRNIITTSMETSPNYEKNVVSLITGYL
jgi:hypothetical protein